MIQYAEVQCEPSASPTRAADERRRLEAELAEHLARHGTVLLPPLEG